MFRTIEPEQNLSIGSSHNERKSIEQYMNEHNVYCVLEKLAQLIFTIKPAKPRTFLSENLKSLIEFKKEAENHNNAYLLQENPILIFNKNAIESIFDLHDVDGKDSLPKSTCEKIIQFMGIRHAEINDVESISKATFVQICSNALLKDIGM